MSLTDLLSMLGQAVVMAALAFGLVCLLISHLRYQGLAGPRSDAVPGTDTLTVLMARRMSTAHREPDPFVVMLVSANPPLDADALTALAQRLRDRLREGDDVIPYREHQLAVVVPASRAAVPSMVERLVEEERVAASLRIGVAAFPEDGRRTDELRRQAEAALAHSLASGQSPAWPPGSTPPAPVVAGTHTGGAAAVGAEQKVLLDELTGVLQASRLGPALQKFVAQCRRDDRPVSVVCLDVDGLRRYNDQYGRRTGDRLLRAVADLLQRITREEDLIARYEEDQFVLALSATPAQALAEAQRLLSGLRRSTFQIEGYSLRLTASLGVAGFPEHGTVARELFDAAQAALQAAKTKGRNQCLLYQASQRKPTNIGSASDAF